MNHVRFLRKFWYWIWIFPLVFWEKGTIFTCIFVKIETGVFDYYCFSDLKFNDFFLLPSVWYDAIFSFIWQHQTLLSVSGKEIYILIKMCFFSWDNVFFLLLLLFFNYSEDEGDSDYCFFFKTFYLLSCKECWMKCLCNSSKAFISWLIFGIVQSICSAFVTTHLKFFMYDCCIAWFLCLWRVSRCLLFLMLRSI